MSNKDLGVDPGAREGSTVPASYKTTTVLLKYTVKSGDSAGEIRITVLYLHNLLYKFVLGHDSK